MSALPDELWRRILELGIRSCGFTFKDLCCLSISSRRLRRLSQEDDLWSLLLSSDFSIDRSASPLLSSKLLYRFRSVFFVFFHGSSESSKNELGLGLRYLFVSDISLGFRFERDREKKIAAHRRAVLRKESQIAEHSRKLRELGFRLAEEKEKMRATLVELSNLSKVRQASVALNVWQPEVIRGRHKQIVEQNVVPVESRVHAVEMELKLCRQQILGFEKAYRDEKQRLGSVTEELKSLNHHPLRPNESVSGVKDVCETNIKSKKQKRCSKDQDKGKRS